MVWNYPNPEPQVSVGDRVYARLRFKYEDLALEQGEVFALRGRVNDKVLVSVGHVTPLPAGAETFPCSRCNVKEFASESQLRSHQRREHGGLAG